MTTSRHGPIVSRRALLRAGAAIGLAAGGLAGVAAAASGTRQKMALVIGNGAYRSAPLKNPVGDARAVAQSLSQLGYEVTLGENTDLRQLLEAMRDFSVRAPRYAVRLLFYAGHGVQVRGRNYLVPVDADPQNAEQIARQAADVGELIERLSAIASGTNIVVLDACRVNPFAGGVIVGPNGRRIRFRGGPGAEGLAPIDAPVGTLVAFSTAPNGIALDGEDGEHSVYAKHLLANMRTPGLPIEQLFKKVRQGVTRDTDRVQVPWESSSLIADFCFRPDAQGHCGG